MPSDEAKVAALTERAAAQQDRILVRLVQFIVARLRRIGASDWYSDREVRAAAEDIAVAVRAGQGTVADMTAAVMAHALQVQGVNARPAPVKLPENLRGVDEVDVWMRPAKEYRRARLVGDDGEAFKAAESRARLLASDDLRLAERTAVTDYLPTVKGITGYRRVLHPELSRTGVCGLCVAASTRIYRTDQLMPVHTRCKCGVLPVTRAWDAGKALNATSLQAYTSVGSTDRAELKKARFRLVNHGELGPVLVAAEGSYAGPDDLKATA